MKPLLVLLIVFGTSLLLLYFINGGLQWNKAGRIGMSSMLLFTAIGHFKLSDGMQQMLPAFVPFKKAIVAGTGFIEMAAAIGLQVPNWQHTIGWWLIIFFILIVPANISAAIRHINYEKGTTDGPGSSYLWFRIPLQLFFIAWVYFSAVHPLNG